jgi:uncharacterized membrane protein
MDRDKERKKDRGGDRVTEILSSFRFSLHFYISLLLIIFIIYKTITMLQGGTFVPDWNMYSSLQIFIYLMAARGP